MDLTKEFYSKPSFLSPQRIYDEGQLSRGGVKLHRRQIGGYIRSERELNEKAARVGKVLLPLLAGPGLLAMRAMMG